MNKVAVYESNPHILAFLKIIFKGNSKFDLVGVCRTKIELISFLREYPIDTLLLSHSGVLDTNIIQTVKDFYPKTRMVAVYYDDSYLRLHDQKEKPKSQLLVDRSIDEYLQDLQTIHFT